MIKLHTMFEKNKLNASRKEELLLIELEGFSVSNIPNTRKQLNVSLCIDISYSMGERLDNKKCFERMLTLDDILNKRNSLDANQFQERNSSKRKIDLVKEASINALSKMQDGDIISIVAFDDSQTLIQEATVLTKENRADIVSAINLLNPRGSTNIHSAWLRSVEEIAKNVNKERLNRVILLTDGQINSGKSNIDDICTDILNVADKNVSTSTFGVGEGFNEVLLSSMSDSGSGNFYFIDDDKNFDILFNEEFTGMSNICATNIKLSLNLKDNLLKDVLTDVIARYDHYEIQDLTSTNKIPLLFNLNSSSLSLGEHNLGTVTVSFKDVEGNSQTIEKEIIIEVVSESTWDLLEDNQEVKVQELLVVVAKNKQKAKHHFDTGNINAAQDVLKASSTILRGTNLSDSRLSAQTNSLEETLNDSETLSSVHLSKKMHYQSYRSLKGKL